MVKAKESERHSLYIKVCKDEILCAAKAVFAEKGFEQATMDEIAKKANFSKGAIYLYFKSKEDLFISLIENYLDEIVAITKAVAEAPKPPAEKIKELVIRNLSYLNDNKEFIRIFSPERGGFLNKVQKKTLKDKVLSKMQAQQILMAQVIKEGIEAGIFRDVDPRIATSAISGMMHTIIAGVIIQGKASSFKKEAQTLIDIFLNGIKK